MKKLKISVVLCTYNGAAYLQPQLDSLLAQTRLPEEVVVTDDCSTDSSLEILQAFAVEADRLGIDVKLSRHPRNMGYVENFSAALRLATGEVLFLCDQDDIWRDDKLALMAARFVDDSKLLLHSEARLVDAHGTSLGCSLFDALQLTPDEKRAIHRGSAFEVVLRRSFVTGATAAMRRELVDLALPVAAGWIHDEWITAIAAAAGRIDFIEEPLIDYRQHDGNQIGMRKRTLAMKWRDLVLPRGQLLGAEAKRLVATGGVSFASSFRQRAGGCGEDRPQAAAFRTARVDWAAAATSAPMAYPARDAAGQLPTLRELARARCCGICCGMTDYSATGVCAVIVSYHPDPLAVLNLVDGVAPQVGAVVLVDNASSGAWQQALGLTMAARGGALLSQPDNVGLAAAQNIGIEWARSREYRHVLLLDQDSEPEPGMVAALLAALRALSATGAAVAAVGPRFHDQREHRHAPFVRLGFPLNRKLWCDGAVQTIACDFLISSGTLIPLDVFDRVGLMDAGLFIDNVDLEWGFRAQARGYGLYGVCGATMHHRLGDARHALPLGAGQVVVHGPLRLYYMMRNRVLLYRMPHTPRVWIAQDLPRVLVKLFLFGVLIGPRRRNLHCMLRGLRDGLRGRQGACPPDLLSRNS